MDQRLMIVINPNAGKSGYKASLADILHRFYSGGWIPTVYFTGGPGDGIALVREHAKDFDRVVCLGGDGTLSEICAGMMQVEQRRPIGYIPLGTANDVSKTLGLSHKPQLAVDNILKERLLPYDIGQFGATEYFTYVAAFGAFTEVSYGTPQESKQALGHLAYMLEGIRRVPMLKDYHAIVEYDNGVIEDDFVFGAVTNSTSVAGLVHLDADRVGLADGLFEVILIKKPQDILDFGSIISSVLSADFSASGTVFLKSREVRILFDEPVAWTRDGENGGLHRDILITNRHPGVEIYV